MSHRLLWISHGAADAHGTAERDGLDQVRYADFPLQIVLGERIGDLPSNEPDAWQNSIAIWKFVISGTLSLTPRAEFRWGLCVAREARQGVWQRAH